MKHITVLKEETVSALALTKDAVVVDCTIGSGGHSSEILKHLGENGRLVGIDADATAIHALMPMAADPRVTLMVGNFRAIGRLLADAHIEAVDAIVADLGWRMEQFSGESGLPRGFSFTHEEPLSMTFGSPESYAFTAFDIVNDWQEEDIANVIYAYGEERYSRRIARRIVDARAKRPIETSTQLAAIVAEAVPKVPGKKTHPATKTFQALRIAVNDELDALRELILGGFESLKPHGRMAIITFHSLEDRIVKETFRTFARDHVAVIVNKKPITAQKEAIAENPRARSAKLRIMEKL